MSVERKTPAVVGVVLAGGLARRMGGGDKGLVALAGRPVLEHVLERLRPQVRLTIVNANGDPERFARFRVPVAHDVLSGNPGPLVGVLTGMDWTVANLPGARWIATVPNDAPFVPTDLVSRLFEAVEARGADMACAVSGGRRHPVVGLWPVDLRIRLRQALMFEDIRKIDRWTQRHAVADVAFADGSPDPFFNVNTPEDLARAERLLSGARPDEFAARSVPG